MDPQQTDNSSTSPLMQKLFPTDPPPARWAPPQWTEFPAAGFSQPACGVIYRRKQQPEQGIPLGSIDTGRLSLDPDGTFGSCTIFNSICPERGPLNLPFLGITVGEQIWSLSNTGGSFASFNRAGIQIPTEIYYWGHYPVADLEYEMPGSPVSVGLRAWAPFIPGDAATSNTPGAVFEVHLRNLSGERQQGRLAFSFPGPTQAEAQTTVHSPRERVNPWPLRPAYHSWVATAPERTRAIRQEVRGEFSGLVVTSEKVNEIGYAIGVIGDEEIEAGAGLDVGDSPYGAGAWHKIGSELRKPGGKVFGDYRWPGEGSGRAASEPPEAGEEFGGSVAVRYELGPGEEKTVRFVLAWYAPGWIGEGDHTFMHMYTQRYTSALDVARYLCREHDSLLRRILAWQEVIYAERSYPVWLRDSLVNILHLFAINSLWAVARPPIGPWCQPEKGLFGLLSGIVEDPAIEPIPDSFYANAPLVYFFPDLALSSLHGYKAYQFPSGAAPFIWGGVVGQAGDGHEPSAGTEFTMPNPGVQDTTNGPCYVDLVDRYLQRTGDEDALREIYPSVKKNTIYIMGLRAEDGADGVISVPSGNVNPGRPWLKEGLLLEMVEATLWFGMTSHVGGIHLAALHMARRMAEKVGDDEFAQQCREWIEQGSQSMETKMWAGDYYLAYNEPATGRKSDLVFAFQLDGQWMTRFHGLPGVFRADRVKPTLETVKRTCVALAPAGAANLARSDGSLAQGAGLGYGPNSFHTPEVLMLAMTYMYEGDREFGLEMARRCVHNIAINILSPWNQPNQIQGETGDREFGSHYGQNMILWAVPPALEGKDIAAFCAPRGLVDRILQAARA